MTEPTVSVADVLAASQGMLQKQLYAIFTKPTDGLGPVLEKLQAHLNFQVDLERRGILFAAGPFWSDDERSWLGEGMVIVRAASLEEARQLAASDPMHQSGARRFEVRPWLINEGSLTVKITFSNGSREIE